MTVQDVYLLTVHEPYSTPEHPMSITATVVHAATLLHPRVPQPDGGRMYRCLTEAPSRTAGQIVPLSTLTFELDGGRLWREVADWERVKDAVVALARNRDCDAMPMDLDEYNQGLLAAGPNTQLITIGPQGRCEVGRHERQQLLDELSGHLHGFLAEAPFWPGAGLVRPPREPAAMPYQPYRSAS